MGVYKQKYPSEAPKLMKYSEIIRDLAVRGYNWRYYDENFRYLRPKDPTAYPWVLCIGSCGLDRNRQDIISRR